MNITHIFFDFGEVLYSGEFNRETLLRAHSLASNQLFSHGININVNEIEKEYNKVISQYLKERNRKEWTLKKILSKTFKGNVNDKLLDKLVETYQLKSADIEMYPSTKKVIQNLPKNKELGIISNTPYNSLSYWLSKDNLLQYFKTITLSSEIGYRKPDSRIYLAALEKANAKPENSLFVYHDEIEGEGARKVGMQTALIEGKNLEKLLEVIGDHG